MLRLPYRTGKAVIVPRRSSFATYRRKNRRNPRFTRQQAALSQAAI
jgi:hypothetical protein